MIGERIKKLRKEKGYSLTLLAEEARVSKSYLSYLERNIKSNPSLQFLSKIATTLDSSIEYLLNQEESVEEVGTTNNLDIEWVEILKNAIDDGMSKDDFEEFSDYIKFKNWKTTNI